MKAIFFNTVLLLCFPLFVLAQTDTLKTTPKKWPFSWIEKLQEGNLSVVPVPVFSVSPEKGASVGIILEYFFNTAKSVDKQHTRLSNAYLNFQYTTRNQMIAEAVYSIYTNEEKYFLQGAFGYKDFYERYWTMSADTVGNNDFRGIDYQQLYMRGKWVKHLNNQLFVGLNYNFNQFNKIELEQKSYPPTPAVSGLSNSRTSGIGPLLIVDKRDHQFSPAKGWFAEVGVRFHEQFLGSAFNFTQYNIDVRRYVPIQSKGILAFNATATLNDGEVPFLDKVKLGNDKIMRGYFAGRFRDNEFAAAQIEYRHFVGKSIVLAGFISAGQTAPSIEQFNLQAMQSCVGGGLRYLINKAKRLYIRFDAGYTQKQNWGFYLNLGDAF